MEREGGKCKPVTASLLLTAPGLRDSSSPRFPRCRFNSIPSAQSSFFFSCFLLAAFDCFAFGIAFISFCMTGYKDLFIKNVGCPELQGGHLQRTVVKTAISAGIWSFFVLP